MSLKSNRQCRALPRIALLACLAWGLQAPLHAADAVALNAAQIKALGIETAPLARHGGSELGGLAAEVAVPNSQMHVVSAPIAGLIERVAVSANATVRAGQLLARLQSPVLAELQRGYLQASVQAQLAADNLQRDEALFRDGIIAESRLRAARGQQAEAAAALAERRQALRMAGVPDATMARLKSGQGIGAGIDIVAPADGVVLEQAVSVGTRVEPATLLFKLAKLDPLWLEIQVPVAAASGIAVGATVAVSAAKASGRVISIGRSVGANQTVQVRAEMNRGTSTLSPGQIVEARIESQAAAGATPYRVPNEALVRVDGKVLVFVQSASGFVATPVTLLGEESTGSRIGGPFKGDERIAVRGVAALKARLAGIGAE